MTEARARTVAERLRDGTRAQHDAIEDLVDWESRATAPAPYRRWLLRMHGFHQRWEPAAGEALADPAFFDPRRKLHLLAADLDRLGADGADAGTAPPWPWPDGFASRAEVLGSMYVLEGSMLGGQLIARRAKAAFGFDVSYHLAYGSATGGMWQSFKRKLEIEIGEERFEEALRSALTTFVYLHALIASDRVSAPPDTMGQTSC